MFISKYNSLTKDLYKIVLEFSFVFSDAKSTREYKYANKAFLSNATFFSKIATGTSKIKCIYQI